MAYSDFTLSELKEKFQIVIEEKTNIFPDIREEKISDYLIGTLAENIPLALAIHTEKARSEMIVTPVLIELRKILNRRISLFSGVEFNVDKEKGLNGVCNYIISLSEEQLYVSSPVISVVEAKNDNIKSGLAQCAAEMMAYRIFNKQKGNRISTIYGIVTTGSIWKFLKLNDALYLYIDVREYGSATQVMLTKLTLFTEYYPVFPFPGILHRTGIRNTGSRCITVSDSFPVSEKCSIFPTG